MADLVRRHAGIADEDAFRGGTVAVEDVLCPDLMLPAAGVLAPEALVGAIVKVEHVEVLELRSCGAEEFFDQPDIGINAAAGIEEQENAHRVAPLSPCLEVEPAALLLEELGLDDDLIAVLLHPDLDVLQQPP